MTIRNQNNWNQYELTLFFKTQGIVRARETETELL